VGKQKSVPISDSLSALDPAFHCEAFQAAIKYRKSHSPKNPSLIQSLIVEEYGDLSRRLDRAEIQESTAVRNVLKTRQLANLIIDDNGDIKVGLLPELIENFKEHLYSLGPERQHDSYRQDHILAALCALRDNRDLVLALRKISKPYSHKNAEQIIRDTLQLPSNAAVTDALTRRAALSAWLCYLRQNVGSCFATAPAIIIHDAQPHAFFQDIDEILSTGRLKRTFGGIEYSAPISVSWGAGDLKRPIYVPRSSDFGTTQLWISPGLLEGFTSIGILDVEESAKARTQALKTIIEQILLKWEGSSPYFFVSAEDIFSAVIKKHLGITSKDLEDYANRPREMIHGVILMKMPKSALGSGGKGEQCARYYVLMEQAGSKFKELADNALLKSWEYTVASFAETKATFSSWNFYSSLGLNQDDVNGIGPCIYKAVQRQLDDINAQVKEYQEQYAAMYGQVRYMETRVRTAGDSEGQWLRAELRSLTNEFKTIQEMRDAANARAQNMASLYSLLVEIYDAMFPKYFQEIYDADIHEVMTGPYDDSPAGFRLVYKFGRANTSQWVPILNANEFIEALVSFFIATEVEITSSPHFEGLKDILARIVSSIVAHVRTREFLESSLIRMARVHNTRIIQNPLDNLDKVEKKPWVYTSGGSMEALVGCYFGLLQRPTNTSRWVESPIELLVYLIDSIKQMPPKEQAALAKSMRPALLMHSPTHAFLFTPKCKRFQELCASDAFTYTWVRDTVAIPMQRFASNIVLDEAKMTYLISLLAEKVPITYRYRFKEVFQRVYGTMSPLDFRAYLVTTMQEEMALSRGGNTIIQPSEIDAFLYAQIPLISRPQVTECVDAILHEMTNVDYDRIPEIMDLLDAHLSVGYEHDIIGAKGLQGLIKGLLCLAYKRTSLPWDCHKQIACAMQKLGFAMPAPILFADTNWVKDYFGFTANPGTGNFELWRFDVTGTEGAPMSMWKHWVDGTQREPPWGIYIHPHEYQR
jgi:hypothetical protein